MKHVKKAENCICRNVVNIIIKMKTIVRMHKMIKIIELHLRNLDRYVSIRTVKKKKKIYEAYVSD